MQPVGSKKLIKEISETISNLGVGICGSRREGSSRREYFRYT
jgi:hypothetical protein